MAPQSPGGIVGAAEQRAAEWGLVLQTDTETGKPQGVKVRTSGEDPNAKPGSNRGIRVIPFRVPVIYQMMRDWEKREVFQEYQRI